MCSVWNGILLPDALFVFHVNRLHKHGRLGERCEDAQEKEHRPESLPLAEPHTGASCVCVHFENEPRWEASLFLSEAPLWDWKLFYINVSPPTLACACMCVRVRVDRPERKPDCLAQRTWVFPCGARRRTAVSVCAGRPKGLRLLRSRRSVGRLFAPKRSKKLQCFSLMYVHLRYLDTATLTRSALVPIYRATLF